MKPVEVTALDMAFGGAGGLIDKLMVPMARNSR